MRLIDHIGQDLTGIGGLSRNSFTDDVLLLADLAGSGRAAARALGMAESTFRGWRKGAVPKGGAHRDTVRRMARMMAVQAHGQAHWVDAYTGEADALLALKGVFVKSSDSRIRTLYVGRHVPLTVITKMMRQWVDGDDLAAEATIVAGIDNHYEPFNFDQIFWARFNDGRE